MQRYCIELTDRLLKSLDEEYNVVDMGAVVDVITVLEKTTITKEVLEITRLGKYINELRRKTNNDALAKRAKHLVRRWRDMVLPSSTQSSSSTTSATTTTTTTTAPTPLSSSQSFNQSSLSSLGIPQNTTSSTSSVLTSFDSGSQDGFCMNGSLKPRSPGISRLVPISRNLSQNSSDLSITGKLVSPGSSVISSDRSLSPNLNPVKQTSNYNYNGPQKLATSNHNHSIEAVPRTHSSNKRLRKDDVNSYQNVLSPYQSKDEDNNSVKRQRVNGENTKIINSQVPSPIKDYSLQDVSSNLDIDTGPKKRGRKKGSKSIKNQVITEDRVKEKLASISRNPKLKTTQELLADLQARGSSVVNNNQTTAATTTTTAASTTVRRPVDSTDDLLRSRDINDDTDDIKKLSNDTNHCNRIPQLDNSKPKDELSCNNELTVEQILSKLPPIDRDSIRWSDDEDDGTLNGLNSDEHDKHESTNEDVDRLHYECIEGLNGNFQVKLTSNNNNINNNNNNQLDEQILINDKVNNLSKKVYKRKVNDETDREFKEWHEMLARPSYDGQILHILPYVIID